MVVRGPRTAPPAHPAGALRWYEALVPLFRLERLLPWRIGQSLIAIAECTVTKRCSRTSWCCPWCPGLQRSRDDRGRAAPAAAGPLRLEVIAVDDAST